MTSEMRDQQALSHSLNEFADELRASGMRPRAVSAYVHRAKLFLEWRTGSPATPAHLSAELPDYATSQADLAPATITAYLDGASRFIAWLAGEYAPQARSTASGDRVLGVFVPPRPVEDFVVEAVVGFLRGSGWAVKPPKAAGTREHGVDVEATLGGRKLLIEAKGWPAEVYVTGQRKGQPKRYLPFTQARAYFSNALLPTLLSWSETDAEIALAFPDKITYRTLVDRSSAALMSMGIGVYFVETDVAPARVRLHLKHTPRSAVGLRA